MLWLISFCIYPILFPKKVLNNWYDIGIPTANKPHHPILKTNITVTIVNVIGAKKAAAKKKNLNYILLKSLDIKLIILPKFLLLMSLWFNFILILYIVVTIDALTQHIVLKHCYQLLCLANKIRYYIKTNNPQYIKAYVKSFFKALFIDC